MAKWNLDEEEYHYKVYDAENSLAGYFQPDYGKIYPPEKEEEIIEQMLKRQDNVYGGILYVPLLKLNLVDEGPDYDLDYVMQSLDASMFRARKWKECIENMPSIIFARARRSHSDPDMLSVLLGVKFDGPVKLNRNDILIALQPILDRFHDSDLL
jgi:hypothetical protein